MLTGVGIWSGALRFGERGAAIEAAGELESLGYSALWTPGGAGGDIFESCAALLRATNSVTIATGIVNVWAHTPQEVAEQHAALTTAHPGRFLLGLGISHGPLVDAMKLGTYDKPMAVMRAYLDGLDRANPPVPRNEMALAALGPQMLRLARDRTAGAHPYLVTPDHTKLAREVMGAGALLAPEACVVLDAGPAKAKELARAHLATYLRLPNYVNNLLRTGFTEDDVSGTGSDRLIERLIASGDEHVIARRVQEHFDAGADHVCVQIITADRKTLPMDKWRALASAVCS